MSLKEDSEDDIWDYKPLEKKKKRPGPSSAPKGKTTGRRTSRKNPSHSERPPEPTLRTAEAQRSQVDGPSSGQGDRSQVNGQGDRSQVNGQGDRSPAGTSPDDGVSTPPSSGDSCPVCQMPFSVLVVQTQRWHVAECLDSSRDQNEECPDGLCCSSTIPTHYKKFNHTLLALSRANSHAAPLEKIISVPPGPMMKDESSSTVESSQESLSARSHRSASLDDGAETPPSKRPNGLLLLRSPGPEDFKKKKGWSSSTRSQRSVGSSQESPVQLSSEAPEDKPEEDLISYSPLSELPADSALKDSDCRKSLFSHEASEDSMELFSDGFSGEDEVLSQFIDDLESTKVQEPASTSPQLQTLTSSPPVNQHAASASTGGGEALRDIRSSLQSPQSLVLERLRETILASDQQPSPQASTSQSMPPQRSLTKPGQASALKQTDIGVFFGLKPLRQKEKEKEAAGGPDGLGTGSTQSQGSGRRGARRAVRRRSKAAEDPPAADGDKAAEPQRDGGRRGGWRTRRTRVNADGEVELPRCPFYKKIPGTKFAVDAFRYGEIAGITAYFLTHFHSDHYGGLTKKSTFPIYCNKITGNLVKNKLKVAEQYVHVLPMNTSVTVDGVRVVLLDANHCPGAAMLLFFLPDGQIVLHTGDFRADPSMEAYPELLSCRVQTLYLDTTYCSPQYTFPRQQDVINFATSTAFELVTLNPRTLVVCGSYSVGKEKVFLALADVLGSKVCLSRDKFNTMCCLESEQVKQQITTDLKAAQVHVLPMMQLNFKKLQDYLSRFSSQYDQLVAFKPTGWTFSQQLDSVEDIQPETRGNISIYGIPYSEHSSFLELKRFVQWLQPLKIIPTVNVGSWESRRSMERSFSEWMMESRAKQGLKFSEGPWRGASARR